MYNVFAGCAFRNDGLKFMMSDEKIWGSETGEKTSMVEKSLEGVWLAVSAPASRSGLYSGTHEDAVTIQLFRQRFVG